MSRFALIKAVLGPAMRLMFRPRVEGAEHIPGDGPVILAGNHLTFIDSMILPLVCDRQVFFIGKDEYVTGKGLKGRLMAWFFTGVGMIPVDRDGAGAAVAALHTGRRVLEEGRVFGIYPEGTRSPDGRLYRGRTGIARMALEAKVPVIPVIMVDTDTAMPIGQHIPNVMRVGIVIGEPLDFSRYEGMENDRYILRSVTDEIMVALQRLGEQEYDDVYASTVKDRLPARVTRRP